MLPIPLLMKAGPYVAAVVLGLCLLKSCEQLGKQKELTNQAIEIANQNALLAEQERKDRERAESIAEKYQKLAETRRQQFNQKRSEVANAPKEMDGPVAPVLRGVIDGLREPTDPKADKHKADYTAPPV